MKYLKVFTDFQEYMEPLTDEEAGRLYRAMLAYAEDGTKPALTGSERYVWPIARQIIDREAEAYAAKTQINRKNGQKGARRRWHGVEEEQGQRRKTESGLPYADGERHGAHGENGQEKEKEQEQEQEQDQEQDQEQEQEQGQDQEQRDLLSLSPCMCVAKKGACGATHTRKGEDVKRSFGNRRGGPPGG